MDVNTHLAPGRYDRLGFHNNSYFGDTNGKCKSALVLLGV